MHEQHDKLISMIVCVWGGKVVLCCFPLLAACMHDDDRGSRGGHACLRWLKYRRRGVWSSGT